MVKPLPYEVLMATALLAAQEDRKTAARLVSVCWDFANSMIPIIYRAVIYQEDKPKKRPKPPAKPRLKTLLKYGHHVRRLRLRVRFDSTARIILDHCLNVRDLHIETPEPIADPNEHPEHNGDDSVRSKIFSEVFMQKASLRKFSTQFFHCLPDDYHESNAFSSLTHFSWNPWSGNVHWSMPKLTHLVVESCVTYETAAQILRECKALKVLAILPCYTGKDGLAEAQEDWQSRVGGDKRLVVMGQSIKDPDGIMPEYGYWETGLTLVREGWSLKKAWWEPISEGNN